MSGVAQGVSIPELIETGGQFLIPLLVGLVTKSSTNTKYKWVLLAALTGLNTSLVGMSQQADPASMALTAAFGVLVSVGVKKGIFDPTGVTSWSQSVLVKDKAPSSLPEGSPDDGNAEDLPEMPDEDPETAEAASAAPCPVKHKPGTRASVLCKGVCKKR